MEKSTMMYPGRLEDSFEIRGKLYRLNMAVCFVRRFDHAFPVYNFASLMVDDQGVYYTPMFLN